MTLILIDNNNVDVIFITQNKKKIPEAENGNFFHNFSQNDYINEKKFTKVFCTLIVNGKYEKRKTSIVMIEPYEHRGLLSTLSLSP